MNEELSFNTKFLFYPSIIRLLVDGRYIAISRESGNWIILDNEIELTLFHKLYEGATIGEIVDSYGLTNEDFMNSFQRVLAKIAAREFAGIDNFPRITKLEGFKMLNLYVTNSCNLRCPHCFMNAGAAMENELSVADLKRILTDFKYNGGECVTFTGGEPMMRKDFVGLLQFSKEIGLQNTVLTNGLLWSQEDINKAVNFIEEVQISIDGVDDDTNSHIRGKGNFDRAVRTAKNFAANGVKVSVATTFSKSDLSIDLIPKYKIIKENIEGVAKGEITFKFSKKILLGRGIVPTEKENRDYFEKISAIEDAIRPNVKLENFLLGHQPNTISQNCGIGGISIRADGHVFFCNRVHEIDDYGYIFSRSIKEWMEIGKEINNRTNVEHVEPCCKCDLKNICNGGCRIDDFINCGRTLSHDEWIQNTCSEEKKQLLIEKMTKVFDYYYDFSQ